MQETSQNQMNSFDEPLVCQICGLTSKSNLVSHILRIHKISVVEYKNNFPGHLVIRLSAESLEKMRTTKNLRETANKQLKRDQKKRSLEFDDRLKCRLCDFESYSSLIKHITAKHQILLSDYRLKYPNDIVQRSAKSTCEKAKEKIKEAMWRPEIREKVLEGRSFPSEIKHWTNKGFTAEKAEIFVSDFQKYAGKCQNNYPELLRQKSEENSGQGNPMSIESIMNRHGVSREEAIKLTPCHGRTGESHPFFGKKHTEKALAKIANAPHLKNPSCRSKPEIEIANFCQIIDQTAQENVRIDRFNVDVLFPDKKLIIEHFGTMWHMDPRKYAENDIHPVTKALAKESWERDAKKLETLENLGFIVIVVWECDWYNRKEEIKERIIDAYNRV